MSSRLRIFSRWPLLFVVLFSLVLFLEGCLAATKQSASDDPSSQNSSHSQFDQNSKTATLVSPELPTAAARDDLSALRSPLDSTSGPEGSNETSGSSETGFGLAAISQRIPLGRFRSYRVFSSHQANSNQVHGEITALAVSKDGNRACFGSSDGSVFCSTIITPEQKNKQASHLVSEQLAVRRILPPARPVLAIGLSPNERYLAISRFGNVTVVDLTNNEVVADLTQVSGRIQSLAWDPRGELLALGRASGEVFVWNVFVGSHAGENSLDAVERYGGQNSPIVSLVFHPAGRAFFAAEQNGTITLWRLLRTEEELGLFDKSAVADRNRKGSEDIDLGRTPAAIEDVLLDATGGVLFASTADGSIHRWKVRGLRRLDELYVGPNAVGAIQDVMFQSNKAQVGLLVSIGRGQQVSFWCRNLPADLLDDEVSDVPIVGDRDAEDEAAGRTIEPQVVEGKLENADEDPSTRQRAQRPEKAAELKKVHALLAETEVFLEPIGILRIGDRSSRLWLTQKNGRLTTADVQDLLSDEAIRGRIAGCTP